MKKILLYALPITFLLFTACSKKSDNANPPAVIDQQTVSIHYDETHQYSVTNTPSLTWISSDTTVGTISSAGLFKAKKIGATTIKGTSGKVAVQSVVTVIPYSNLCQEPYFIPGASMSAIKGKESRILYGSTSTLLVYTGENSKLRQAEYLFDNTGLTAAALLLANTTAVANESANFFKERYTYAGTDGANIYLTGDNNLVIGLTVDDQLGFMAVYIKRNTTSNVNSIKNLNKLRIEAIQSLKIKSIK